MSVKVILDKTKQVLSAIREIGKERLLVGIPDSKSSRNDEATNALLGYIHENGSPTNNIPARPFLKPGVKSISAKASMMFRQGAKNALKLKPGGFRQTLVKVGLLAQAAVKKTIVDGKGFVPLKPATIAARQRMGITSVKPLIRTGQLLNSITFVIRKK